MVATTDRRSRRRERTRDEIVAAAWRLAERDGIAGLSLRDLAAEVGMQAPSLYTYFDSKAGIYDAMFAEGYREFERAVDELEHELDETADPRDVLIATMQGWLEFCQASLPRYQLMFTRVVADWEPSPEAYEVSVASYQRMAAALERLGVQGQDGLDLWTALSAGLAAQQLANDPDGDRWVRLVPDAVDLFLAHLEGSRR